MSHKFFFTWEAQYLLHQELGTRTKAFLAKYGEQWVFIFKSDAIDQSTIVNAIFAWWMFSTKKLVIVYGIPKDGNSSNKTSAAKANPVEEYLLEHREQIPLDTILILVSYKPDKRTKAYKFFSKNAEVKAYAPLNAQQCEWFVKHKLGELISPSQTGLIVSSVGENLFNLANEAEKLIAYAAYNKISSYTDEQIHAIVYSQSEIDSFKILDNIFTNKEKALSLITQAQHQQQDTFQFLGMLYRGLKLVIQMVDLHQQWVQSSKEIAATLNLHPFAVAKQHKNIKRLDGNYEAIREFLNQLVQLDRSIKSWTYPNEAFWLKIKSLVHEL